MSVTLQELKAKLVAAYDEVTLLDLLGVDSEQLVERFEDVIEERFDALCKEFQEESQDS